MLAVSIAGEFSGLPNGSDTSESIISRRDSLASSPVGVYEFVGLVLGIVFQSGPAALCCEFVAFGFGAIGGFAIVCDCSNLDFRSLTLCSVVMRTAAYCHKLLPTKICLQFLLSQLSCC